MNAIRKSTKREPGIIRRLYSLILPYRRTVAIGMIFLLLSVAAELYPPLGWQRVVDIGLAHGDWAYIGWELVLLVVVFGIGQLCSAIRGVLLERAGHQLTLDLRLQLYDKLQSQSAAYFAQHRSGDLLARLTADIESVQDVLVRGTDSVVANGLRVLGVAGIFIALQPVLGLIVLVPMFVVGLLLARRRPGGGDRRRADCRR